MILEAFFAALLGTAAAQLSPGPNLIAVASAALGQGRRAALLTVAGIASGMLIWAVGMAAGLGTLVQSYPASLVMLKLLGGGYLVWLGLKAALAAVRGSDIRLRTGEARLSDGAAWRRGLLVVLTNPKAALMWAAVASFLFGSGLSAAEVAFFGPVGALSGGLIYGGYAFLFSTGAVASAYARFWRAVEAGMATAFGALGLTLLMDGLKTIGERVAR